jgi:hypothetical protein
MGPRLDSELVGDELDVTLVLGGHARADTHTLVRVDVQMLGLPNERNIGPRRLSEMWISAGPDFGLVGTGKRQHDQRESVLVATKKSRSSEGHDGCAHSHACGVRRVCR